MTNLESWGPTLDNWQKVVSEPFLIYAKSMQIIFVPNSTIKKGITDAWMDMWNYLPQTNLLSLPNFVERKSDTSSFNSVKDLSEMWEKGWSTFGTDPFTWYMKFIQNITEFWMNYWKKSN